MLLINIIHHNIAIKFEVFDTKNSLFILIKETCTYIILRSNDCFCFLTMHEVFYVQPILCESFYISLEYGRSAMFMWMFVEGMYLNNLISVAFFQGPPNYSAYYIIGWGE